MNSILFERFVQDGNLDDFEETEAVALLLEISGCRTRIYEKSQKLVSAFGGFKGVLEAEEVQLRKEGGLTRKEASTIRLVISMMKFWERMCLTEAGYIRNRHDAERYCKSLLTGLRAEQFHVICLSGQCRVLGSEKVSDGSLNEVSAYPRRVIEIALNHNAHSVILCHNHPGGTRRPSAEDITSTKQLQNVLKAVGILVLDHIIIAETDAYSMAFSGDIKI